jgi:hypothetical protein
MGRDRISGRPGVEPPRQPQQAAPSAADKGSNKPVHEVRLGRIKAAVWANAGESGVWYSVVFSRLYKEGDAWKRSDSFSRDDLPLVAKIADQVHTWVYEQNGTGEPPA